MLRLLPVPAPGLSTVNQIEALISHALRLTRSARQRESNAGALILRFVGVTSVACNGVVVQIEPTEAYGGESAVSVSLANLGIEEAERLWLVTLCGEIRVRTLCFDATLVCCPLTLSIIAGTPSSSIHGPHFGAVKSSHDPWHD